MKTRVKTKEKMKINLKQALTKFKGWTPYRLAKEIERNQQTVYSWSNGRTSPSYEDLKKLCEVIGCTGSDLLGF